MKKYYEHSGIIGLTGFFLVPLTAILGGILIGGLFGLMEAKIPFLVVKIASPVICGALVGASIGVSGLAAKVTNTKFLALFAFIGAAIAVYFCWVGFIWGVTDFKLVARSPSQVWATIKLFALTGVWSLKGLTPKGGVLYSIWIIEAGVIVLLSMFLSIIFTLESVYCERCRKWAKKESFGPFKYIDFNKEKIDTIEKDSLKILENISPVDDPSKFTKIDIYSCETCRDCNYLSAVKETVTKDSKGKDVRNSVTVIDRLYVTGESMKKIKDSMVKTA